MGTQMLRLLPEFPALTLVGAVASERSATLGQQVGAIAISAQLSPVLERGADLVIDFSSASSAAEHLAACVAARVALLLGTTGLAPALASPLAAAAQLIPLLVAPNTSPGVALLLELVRQSAQALPAGYDIEIVETHHRDKRDAPSGTALALGEAAAEGRGTTLGGQAVYGWHGQRIGRGRGQIGLSSLRGGDVVGEHEICFLGDGERLVLKHVATDRSVFARGALQAGQWLAGRQAGRYGMRDVFMSGYK
jgi:4-hydroxy-tetrahydrodipicolinate reductase